MSDNVEYYVKKIFLGLIFFFIRSVLFIIDFVYEKLHLYKLFNPNVILAFAPLLVAVFQMLDWTINLTTDLSNGVSFTYSIPHLFPRILIIIASILIMKAFKIEEFTNRSLVYLTIGWLLIFINNSYFNYGTPTMMLAMYITYVIIDLLRSTHDESILQKLPILKNMDNFSNILTAESFSNNVVGFRPLYFVKESVIMVFFFLAFSISFTITDYTNLKNLSVSIQAMIITFIPLITFPYLAGLLNRIELFNKIFYFISFESLAFSVDRTTTENIKDIQRTRYRRVEGYRPQTYRTKHQSRENVYGTIVDVNYTVEHERLVKGSWTERIESNYGFAHAIVTLMKLVASFFINILLIIYSPILFPLVYLVQLIISVKIQLVEPVDNH